jgi:hypothetical protein
MAQLTKSLDDTLPTAVMRDITGGLNTQDGATSLASNETFSCQNVIGFNGRTIYIGGYALYTAGGVAAPADGNWQFYDANNAKHLIEWRGGNMYDTVNGVLVTITTGVYIAGQNIGRVDQNGILYWCTATVTVQQYNGSTNTAVISSGTTGTVAIPSGTCMCSYAGSIVVGNPTIAGVKAPGSFIPSNVNDPTSFIGANETATGANNFIQGMVPMGVASGGVPPTNSIMVVGSEFVILAQGAINSLKLNSVNIPIGCQDGNSIQYIPSGDLLGVVIFLGNDNQFWETNGITGDTISKKILDYLNITVQASKQINPVQRFSAGYNTRYQYYICDLGQNQQLVYRWQLKAWYYVKGWPSGFYCNGTTGIGFPANYVSSTGSVTAGMYLVGQDNINFGGQNPVIFYNTAYMHGNDVSMMKEWQRLQLTMNNLLPAYYQVTATGLAYAQVPAPVSNVLTFGNPTALAMVKTSDGIWDVSKWDAALWGPGLSTASQQPYPVSGMLVQNVPTSDWVPAATTQPLRSSAVSFNISWTANGVVNAIPSFDTGGLQGQYKPMGHLMVGGQQYSAESGAAGTSYPFT